MQEQFSTRRLVDGYHKAFIDSTIEADSSYSPQFISNSNGKKVLTVIENELKGCDDLFISVAFITMGGIAPLLGTLKDLEERGAKGRILTTDYLMFSDPKALDKLNGLSNLDVRVFKTAENNIGFHTKGYMFHNNGDLRIIVGSSNLTQRHWFLIGCRKSSHAILKRLFITAERERCSYQQQVQERHLHLHLLCANCFLIIY